MISATCIAKNTNSNGKIESYVLRTPNEDVTVKPDYLKQAIQAGELTVDNLKLTTDGRLISKTKKSNDRLASNSKKSDDKLTAKDKGSNDSNRCVTIKEFNQLVKQLDLMYKIQFGCSYKELINDRDRIEQLTEDCFLNSVGKQLTKYADNIVKAFIRFDDYNNAFDRDRNWMLYIDAQEELQKQVLNLLRDKPRCLEKLDISTTSLDNIDYNAKLLNKIDKLFKLGIADRIYSIRISGGKP